MLRIRLYCFVSDYFTAIFIDFIEPAFWASIYYYEETNMVGDRFDAFKNEITIDGYTDPSNPKRFCLGQFSNIFRNPTIVNTRRYIGQGLELIYIFGKVQVECLTDKQIFVQSANYNVRHKQDTSKVVRMSMGETATLFDSKDFALRLKESIVDGYQSVYDLTRMCKIHISFIKGWGEEYRKRKLTSTPCWIEIHLQGAMQWVDKVLRVTRGPQGLIRSDS